VFVSRIRISASCMRIFPSVTYVYPLDSSLDMSAVLLFLPIERDLQPTHGGASIGLNKFACDMSSALEWCGLFMCAASVVRVSFYSSCCTKTQKKYIIYKTQEALECTWSLYLELFLEAWQLAILGKFSNRTIRCG